MTIRFFCGNPSELIQPSHLQYKGYKNQHFQYVLLISYGFDVSLLAKQGEEALKLPST